MGNASLCIFCKFSTSVHPHVHGERGSFYKRGLSSNGSSPRAWGTLSMTFVGYLDDRFIPTCMGNATVPTPAGYLNTVHPHVHGERSSKVTTSLFNPGSSPRAWGTLLSDRASLFLFRFIPTCMGNALPVPVPNAPITVHPHVHGERISACN